ncbi:MAG TPA: hypothetical protein PLC99_13425 [Verrucomicrobiota bacterium]|nr:hypothetical protein [Verrucomicrobiota bacterium]
MKDAVLNYDYLIRKLEGELHFEGLLFGGEGLDSFRGWCLERKRRELVGLKAVRDFLAMEKIRGDLF